VGAITAFVAATQGLVALELKKALAFSTVSQIGYMWIGLGMAGLSGSVLLGGTTSGIFHLVSHAVFKACLFLCAGSVIHSAHSIYMNDMGSMRKYMPLTWIFMLIAAVCLMGIPPLPGFYSKDAILLSALEAHQLPIFIIAVITVVLTAFYTTRMVGMVFYGQESEQIKHIKQEGGHIHEASPTMWGACGVLAIIIVGLGLVGPALPLVHGGEHPFNYHTLVLVLSIGSILLGAIPAYMMYISRKWDPKAIVAGSSSLQVFHKFFWNRWFIDALYLKVFVDGMFKLADFVAYTVEDGFDNLVHRRIPTLITQRCPAVMFKLRTESDDLLYNISYVVAIFVFLLFVVLK
jgi:NADH-quinone oxidoreductase subunit L